nr:hypothetical protein [uncultured Cohaesibacter sp.]
MSQSIGSIANTHQRPEEPPIRRVGRGWLFALGLSLVLSAASALWVGLQDESYSASARILILAPNERYVPEQGGDTPLAHWQDADKIVADATQLLFGDGNAAHKQAARTALSFDPALRTLTLRVTDKERAGAMNAANGLAVSYLNKLKARRADNLLEAAGKLAADIAAIENQQVALTAELATNPMQQLADESAREAWVAKENQRISGIQKSIAATDRILNNMRALHQQALTKQKYDLLPPEARLLERASLPEFSIKANALDRFGLTFGLCFLPIVGLLSLRARRNRRQSIERTITRPELPVALPLVAPMVEVPASVGEKHENEVCCSGEPEKARAPELEHVAELDLDAVALQMLAAHRKRIVLLSEDGCWTDLSDGLMQALMDLDQSVFLVKLADSGSDHAGIADLIDQTASYSDLVQIDEVTGLHHIDAGRRALVPEDFFSHDFHALLLALEQACDMVLIDLGTHYDNDYALKSLGIARDALACIHAPDTGKAVAEQVRSVMQHFGYQDSLILPVDSIQVPELDRFDLQMASIAAQ